jgi:drug/metabolite transporter (DMT)-like permease
LRDLGGVGWRRGGLLAALTGAPYFYGVMAGLHYAPAAHGTVLNPGATSLASLVFGYLLLGLRPTRMMVFAGVPLILAGLVLVSGAGFAVTGGAAWRGDALLIVTGLAYGLFFSLLRRWRIPALPATSTVAVLSAAAWLPIYAVTVDFEALRAVPPAMIVGQALFQGAVVSGLAVFLFARAVTVLGPARAGLFPALVPVFGTVFAALWLGEPLSGWQVGGVIAVCTGLLLGVWQPEWRPWRRRASASPHGNMT